MFPRRRRVRQPTHCSVPGSPWRHGGSMFVSARNAAVTSSVGSSLEGHSSKTQQRSWSTMTARWQHGCLWQEPCMDVSMIELSRRRTLESKNRKEGNGKPPRLFSLDMIPIDGCFEDVLQLWPLFFDVNCRLPPVIDGCFKDVLQQWPLFFVVDCRLPSDGSHWPAVKQQNTRRRLLPSQALKDNNLLCFTV